MAVPVTYMAYDNNAGAYKAGDAANHAISLSRDGVVTAATNAPTDLSGGASKIILTDAEYAAGDIILFGTSTTSGVIIVSRVVKLASDKDIADAIAVIDGVVDGITSDISVVETSVSALGTGETVRVSPVGAGGKVSLYSGVDYTSDTTTIDIPDSSPSSLPIAGTAVSLTAVTDQYLDSQSFTLTGEVVDVSGALVARIEGVKADIGAVGNYRYFLTHSPSGTLTKLNITGNLVVLDGIPS